MRASRFSKILRRDLGLKLFALAWGIGIWSFLASQGEVEAPFEAGVHYSGIPGDLELNPDQVDRITVMLRGPRAQLSELHRHGLSVELDFSDVYQPGETTFTVDESNLQLPARVRLIQAIPSQVRLSLERRARREVPVQPALVGGYQTGYTLGSFSVYPPSLVIVGPESRVSLVDAVTTDPIDISEVIARERFVATAYVPDPYLRFEQNPRVHVEVVMERQAR